jgi:AhpD family alkylhydroperoxidase
MGDVRVSCCRQRGHLSLQEIKAMPKPFLNRVSKADMPADIREAFEHSLKLRGDATFFEIFANHPELYRWYTGSFYGEVFRGGRVPRRTKELVRLRLSTRHGCRFCNQGNRVDAMAAGLSADDLDALADYESSELEPACKAALRLADQMLLTNSEGRLDEALYEDLREHYDDAQILELGVVLGILTGMARFLFAFDLVEREANCPIHSDS